MTTLFNANQVHHHRSFGKGLFTFVPYTRIEHTASDEDAYREMLADEAQAERDFNAYLEERAAHAAMRDRVCRGPIL